MRDPSKYILQGQSSLMNNGKNSIPPFIPSSRKHRALLFKLWCETGSPRCYLGAHQNCRISGLTSGRLNRHLHSSKVPRMLHVHLSLRSTGLEGKVNGRVNHFISIRDQRRYDLKCSSGLNLALLPRLQILWYLSFEGKNSKDQIISLICFSNRLWEPSLPQAWAVRVGRSLRDLHSSSALSCCPDHPRPPPLHRWGPEKGSNLLKVTYRPGADLPEAPSWSLSLPYVKFGAIFFFPVNSAYHFRKMI